MFLLRGKEAPTMLSQNKVDQTDPLFVQACGVQECKSFCHTELLFCQFTQDYNLSLAPTPYEAFLGSSQPGISQAQVGF